MYKGGETKKNFRLRDPVPMCLTFWNLKFFLNIQCTMYNYKIIT